MVRAGVAEAAFAAARAAESRISAEEAKRKFTRIDAFEGPFDFLAMDYESNVAWDGAMYPTAKHAILAAQYPTAAGFIGKTNTPDEALQAIEGEQEASDWNSKRLKVMEKILRDKFRRSDDFRSRLKETGDREMVWENDEDNFWGAIKGRGQNHLGRLLSEIRQNIQDGAEMDTFLYINCELESDEIRRPPLELLEQKSDANGAVEQSKVHRLSGSGTYKLGKLPKSAVVAIHPSISREHAMIVHSKSEACQSTGGLALMDLGSKSGVSINDRKLQHPFVMEPIRNGDVIRLGVSTRTYTVKVNLSAQIEALERQHRELMKEVEAIDKDAANPVEAAKRAAKDEATVFVGNLDYDTEKADMLILFQDCGKVEEVRFPGGESKASRGICFVVFDSPISARRAVGLNGESYKQRKVKVSPATEGGKGKGGGGKDGGKGKGKGKAFDDHDDRTFGRSSTDWKHDRFDEVKDPREHSPKEDSRAMMQGGGRSRREERDGDGGRRAGGSPDRRRDRDDRDDDRRRRDRSRSRDREHRGSRGDGGRDRRGRRSREREDDRGDRRRRGDRREEEKKARRPSPSASSGDDKEPPKKKQKSKKAKSDSDSGSDDSSATGQKRSGKDERKRR